MQTPTNVWVIIRKDKPSIYFEQSEMQRLIDAINANDFVYMSIYQCTIHKFDIDEIKIVKMTTPISKDIEYQISKLPDTSQPSLSFNDYVKWMQQPSMN